MILSKLSNNSKIGIILFIFSFIFMFFTSQCSPLFVYNDWCDPHIYFSMGKGALHGQVLYRDIFDHKGPLIFFIYGLGYLISNTNLYGIYIFESLILFINLLFVYKIAGLFTERKSAFLVSLVCALLFSHKTEMGGGADEFIAPCIIVSFYYFILYFRRNSETEINLNRHLFIHGVMFGCAFFIKFTACAFWVPLLFSILYDLLKGKQYKKIIQGILYFFIGSLLIVAPIIIYFIANSALSDFYFGYFEFNALYASPNNTIGKVMYNIVDRFARSVVYDYIFFLLILFGALVTLLSNKYIENKVYRVSMFVCFLFTYLSIVVAPYNMNYAYVILPVFAIVGLVFLLDIVDKRKFKINSTAYYLISFSLILTIGIFNKRLFDRGTDCVLREDKCSPAQKEFADIINTRINPTLIGLDVEIGVATTANIVPTHKYFFHPAVLDVTFPEIVESQINMIINRDPMFILTANVRFPHLQENYDLVKTHGDLFLFERKE